MFLFFFSLPLPRMEVSEKCPPQGLEIHFLCNYYFVSCFSLFPQPRVEGVFSHF